MKLKPGEICLIQNCKYANDPSEFGQCQGKNPARLTPFVCDYVDSNGNVSENVFRSKLDITGKMTILNESGI